MSKLKVLALVMAGGEGTRLNPLTRERSKPAVPFGARNRIIDFVLSNLVNSGIHSIYLLVQYKSQSLIEHVRKAWVLPPTLPTHFITVVPPQMSVGQEWFQGTADAVFQNLNLIQRHDPHLVLVFGADHIYRMDVRQMIQYHQERRAAVTVAALPVPREQASSFGIIDADAHGRVHSFLEKPDQPPPMLNRPTHAYASMGNYLFNTDILYKVLEKCRTEGGNDFGKHVLPCLLEAGRLYAYDFANNRVPGVQAYEEPAYWRDVGTLDAYFDAHQDVLGLEPRFDLFNSRWPIYSCNYQGPAARFVDSRLDNSMISAGCRIDGAHIRNSVLRREVVVEPGAEIEDCVIMDYVTVRRGAKLKRAIVDRYNVIEANVSIGHDLVLDRSLYHVTPSNIVALPRGRHHGTLSTSFTGEV
jgi:glucose-1-phosphate adenylyltransferase